jgi:hypothetical protein
MDNVLVDDRRIKVDFSQSVAKIWYVHIILSRRFSCVPENGEDWCVQEQVCHEAAGDQDQVTRR